LSATAGTCASIYNFSLPSASDNCGTATVTQTSGPSSGTTFALGTTTLTFEAIDGAGNKSTCTYDVTVVDSENPIVNCPGNLSQNSPLGACGLTVTFAAVTASDNCSGVSVAQIAGLSSGSFFPGGTTTNTFVATDAAGNTDTCSFDVIVNDLENPTIVCPGDTTLTADTTGGACGAALTYTVTGADNCTFTITQTAGLASGSVFPAGVTTNTYLITDVSGNTATCSFDVTVDASAILPVAGYSDTAGASLQVLFTDTSKNGTSYRWDFGDGSADSTQSPSHTYAAAGTYYVCQWVTNSCGSDSICDSVVVKPTGVEEIFSADNVRIYPNPSNGEFTIIFHGNVNDDYTLEVFNGLGQVIKTEQLVSVSNNYQKEIKLGYVAMGNYLLKVVSADGSKMMTKKLIIRDNRF